jgi:exosortase A-associated hydrolase 1
MEAILRRLLTIECEGERLGASFDGAEGDTAFLVVTGGSQTRIGSHRLFERLAAGLAAAGHPALRFDRRGVGDSSGEDPGFRACAADIAAAAAALREQAPEARRLIGLGLCDGASALALQGAAASLQALVLVNPWLVEAEADSPPPAAIRDHYRKRLSSVDGWKKILMGGISYRQALKGVAKIAGGSEASPLAGQVAEALRRHRRPTAMILAAGDATAVAAAAEAGAPAFAGLVDVTLEIDTDSHTFARSGDLEALLEAVLEAAERLDA